MRVLVHICCGPCAITVLQHLLETGDRPEGFFFNPNIQPLAEYLRRREGAAQVAARLGIPLIQADALPRQEQAWRDPWRTDAATAPWPDSSPLPPAADPVPWLRAVAGREQERCTFCTRLRLRQCAETAKAGGYDAFSSSLLYSRHQNHEQIHACGRELAQELGIDFVYQDFRRYWQDGIRISKEWGVYRQQYCGCVFSEYERYSRDFAKAREKGGEGENASGGQGAALDPPRGETEPPQSSMGVPRDI